MNKKMFLPIVLSILVLSVSFSMQQPLIQHQNPRSNANVFIFIETVEGNYMLTSGNVITNIGEQYTRNAFSQGGTISKVEYISIGNVTAGVTKTQLDSEYDRKQGTIAEWENSGDYAFNCTYKWTFTETKRIDGAGGHWSASGDNNMYACANFPEGAVTFNNNDNLTIRWVYTYDAN